MKKISKMSEKNIKSEKKHKNNNKNYHIKRFSAQNTILKYLTVSSTMQWLP
jgi:hypothetical protein